MPDPIFGDPRLARLYDAFDGTRDDLGLYLDLARRFGARDVLDVGCGTGCFALLAADIGLRVTGVDPAAASVEIARAKPGAGHVTWHIGDAVTAPAGPFDLAVMTGNVAQVFVADEEWPATLRAIRERLRPTGHLVFETRRPEDRAWEGWRTRGDVTLDVAGVGSVRERLTVVAVEPPLVTFRHAYRFPDGTELTSESTLRFRGDEEVRAVLGRAGLVVTEVHDAPDRPGRERVYVATPA